MYFSKNFENWRPLTNFRVRDSVHLAASTLFKGMFDEIIVLQRYLEYSYALPSTDELLCDFSNSNSCLLCATNALFTKLLCLAVLQCRCTVKLFSAVTFTSHNLQNKIIPSVLKYFSPNCLTKPRNLTPSEHFTLGVLKVETVLSYCAFEM